jgi:glycosyltransferase involved in cell wall biosynthesis
MIDDDVSVIIPAFNEADTIGPLVERLKELYPSFEIIVVEDSSSDATAEAARKAGALVSNIPTTSGITLRVNGVKEEEKELLYEEIFEQEDTAMLAQYIREKGFQEGLVKGELKEKLEGKCSLLERQLTRRFGPIPAWAKEQLASATDAQLDSWAERILDAETIQEVLAQ